MNALGLGERPRTVTAESALESGAHPAAAGVTIPSGISPRPLPCEIDAATAPIVTPWAELIVAVIALRILVSLTGAGIMLLLPRSHQSHSLAALLLEPWRHFDALWFTQIAAHGYGSSPLTTAYMPLYPLLIRIVALATGGHYLVAALIVSNLSLVAGVGLLWRWVAELFTPRVAWRAIALLLVFPDAFFLVGSYSEATFLALSAGCLLALRRDRPLLAGALALLATLTRLQGLVLVVPMLLALRPHAALLLQRLRRAHYPLAHACRALANHVAVHAVSNPPRTAAVEAPTFRLDVHDSRIAAADENRLEPTAVGVVPAIRPQSEAPAVGGLAPGLIGAALPLLGFALYQRALTASLPGGSVLDTYRTQWHIPLQAPWQTIWQYVQVIRSPRWHLIHSPQYNYILLWYLLIALFSLGVLLASWRRLGWELTVFSIAGWCFLMTRWYSTGRYMLSVLPLFIAFALWTDGHRRFRWFTTTSALILVFFTAEFAQNSWVD